MVTLEALASGTPVVGTTAGATPELLEPLDQRLVAGSSDPESLAAAIAKPWPSAMRTSRRAAASMRWRGSTGMGSRECGRRSSSEVVLNESEPGSRARLR